MAGRGLALLPRATRKPPRAPSIQVGASESLATVAGQRLRSLAGLATAVQPAYELPLHLVPAGEVRAAVSAGPVGQTLDVAAVGAAGEEEGVAAPQRRVTRRVRNLRYGLHGPARRRRCGVLPSDLQRAGRGQGGGPVPLGSGREPRRRRRLIRRPFQPRFVRKPRGSVVGNVEVVGILRRQFQNSALGR